MEKPIDYSSLEKIKLFLFDFDGVFTSGKKNENFNERDSMGINLLRFGYYLSTKNIPEIAIVTGENNKTAIDFAKREHLDYLFLGFKDKKSIFETLNHKKSIQKPEVAIIYDDINDLSLVEKTGLKFLVNQPGSFFFHKLIKTQNKFDYMTKEYGGNGAVREICELILDRLKIFGKCIEERTNFTRTYQNYWNIRQNVKTKIVSFKNTKL